MTTANPNDGLREKYNDDFISRWERFADQFSAQLSAPEYRAGLEQTAEAIRSLREHGQAPETDRPEQGQDQI